MKWSPRPADLQSSDDRHVRHPDAGILSTAEAAAIGGCLQYAAQDVGDSRRRRQ